MSDILLLEHNGKHIVPLISYPDDAIGTSIHLCAYLFFSIFNSREKI